MLFLDKSKNVMHEILGSWAMYGKNPFTQYKLYFHSRIEEVIIFKSIYALRNSVDKESLISGCGCGLQSTIFSKK